MKDITAPNARIERDQLATRTDVLDKVGVLRTLPDDMHVTTDMVAEFYEVPLGTISQLTSRNRDELDSDGYRVVTRGAFEGTYKMSVPSSASRIALFPRRAVLRVGMLLRDSELAKRVRSYLLDAEQASATPSIPDITTPTGLLALTEMFQQTALKLVVESEARQQLESVVERQAPLVAKAEAHTASTTSINRQDFAREVQTWGKRVRGMWILQEHVLAFLGHKGVTIRGDRSDAGQATATAIRSGWAENSKYTDPKTKRTFVTARILPKGQDLAWKWITAYIEENGTLQLPGELNGGDAA
ncbi:phage antirepressor KilAC domain-containing protein [Rhodococcus jostii]|uniref:phage antirepressor KilAC domain-containing protein n=1 Tax=Rhodococcus jostii TaxID=132919 RepID=UPI0036393C35